MVKSPNRRTLALGYIQHETPIESPLKTLGKFLRKTSTLLWRIVYTLTVWPAMERLSFALIQRKNWMRG